MQHIPKWINNCYKKILDIQKTKKSVKVVDVPLLDLLQKKIKKRTQAKSAFHIFHSERKDLIAAFKKDAMELYPDDAGGQQGHINASLKRELIKEQDPYEELAKRANEEEEALSADEEAEEDEQLPREK